MSKQIRIFVQSDEDDANHSKFKNFGEDVWRYCRDTGNASMRLEDVDRSTDALMLSSVPARKARRVRQDILAIAEAHNLSGDKILVEIK